MSGALTLRAINFKSCYLRNDGGGKFQLFALPDVAQAAPLNGMVVDDYNADGNLDVAITGNDYGNEVFNGRYDAMNGLLLLGDGKGNFAAQTILQSGLYIPLDAKALIKLRSYDNGYLLAASQNKAPLKVFRLRQNLQCIPLQKGEVSAQVKLKSGSLQKQEFYYGSSFLSQSARFLTVNNSVASVIFYDNKGESRRLNF